MAMSCVPAGASKVPTLAIPGNSCKPVTPQLPISYLTGSGLDGFENFWNGEESPRKEPRTSLLTARTYGSSTTDSSPLQTHRLDTPRKGEAHLEVFQVATPASSPKAADDETRFVPYWPWGPRWPFNVAPTSLELQNLPRNCDEATVVAQLDEWGFSGKYNFVHCKMERRAGCTAVVNACTHADGIAIASKLHRFSDWTVASTARHGMPDVCAVSWSFRAQGLDALVQMYHNASWSANNGITSYPWISFQGAWMYLAWCSADQSPEPSADQPLYTARF
jgi:hypothetical protein